METFSLADIKKKNRADVYHFIYSNPGCSKQAIAQTLAISLPTVSQHLAALLEEGLIEKCGQLASNVGRRATAYQIVSTARISIGIEVLARNVYIVALNLYGKKEGKEKYRLDFQPGQAYFEQLKEVVCAFLEKYQYTREQLLGIGLGVQGLVSPDGLQITYGKILDCTGLSILPFADFFSVPCKFIHDAECASNSELWENPGIRDAIYLSLGYHLGGAILINGELQNGLTGKTGTFEHMTLIPDGLDCYCGKKGCAECYCSGNSLLEPEMELDDFFREKEQGNAACQKKWEKYLDYLAMLINNLHMVLESTIVLGGHITPYFTDQDLDSLKEKVLERSTFPGDPSYLIQGKCRIDAVSIGAALPFIKDFLKEIAFQEPKRE
ncbi:MAG: ROK family transcriptional regulator [Candidatus Limivivens sp.]|nr:ROK family transcriptional regulator [Candidatus Limivivens sp.]